MTDSTDKKPVQQAALWIQDHLKGVVFGLGAVCVFGFCVFALFQWRESREKRVYNEIYVHRSALERAHKKANGENHIRGRKNIADFFQRKKPSPFVYSEEMKAGAVAYEKALRANQHSPAGAVGAVDLADFYYLAGEKEKALSLLSLFSAPSSGFFRRKRDGSVGALVRLQLAGFYMNEKNCEKALPLLFAVTETKKAEPFHPPAWLNIGLCHERLKDTARVEEAYGNIISKYPESASARTAEIYLRLFKISQKQNKR